MEYKAERRRDGSEFEFKRNRPRLLFPITDAAPRISPSHPENFIECGGSMAKEGAENSFFWLSELARALLGLPTQA